MEEDIKILEERINYFKENPEGCNWTISFEESELIHLENLLKRYKELDEYTLSLEEEDKKYPIKLTENGYKKLIENKGIPISVIQNLIDKLGNMLQETMEGKLQKYTPGEIIFLKRFLENLLEERN